MNGPKNIVMPTVHLNGTSADTLRDGFENAARHLTAAYEAIANAAPNARDYYPQGDHAFYRARTEHEARLGEVRNLIETFEQLAYHVEEVRGRR